VLSVAVCVAGCSTSSAQPDTASGLTAELLDLEDATFADVADPEAFKEAEWQVILAGVASGTPQAPLTEEDLLDGWRALGALSPVPVGRSRSSSREFGPSAGSTIGSGAQVVSISARRRGPSMASPASDGAGGAAFVPAFTAALDIVEGRWKGESGTISNSEETVLPEREGNRVVRRTTTQITTAISGSKITVEVVLKAEHTATSLTSGAVAASHSSEARARFEVGFCPDRDGVVHSRLESRFTERWGTAPPTSQTADLDADGRVNDEALLESVAVRGNVEVEGESGRDELAYRRGGDDSADDAGWATADGRRFAITEAGRSSSVERWVGRVVWVAMLDLFLSKLPQTAEARWRNGECLEVRTPEVDDSNRVEPNSAMSFTAEVWHRFDGDPLQVRVTGSLEGEQSLDPGDSPEDSPVRFTYVAGDEPDKTATVKIETVSRRGMASRDIRFRTGQGWSLDAPPSAASPYNWTGERCDADSVEGRWSMTATAIVGGAPTTETIIIEAATGGSGTWTQEGRSTFGGVPVTSTSGGTATWEQLPNGDVRFDLTRTRPIVVTVDGQTVNMGSWPIASLADVLWSAEGC